MGVTDREAFRALYLEHYGAVLGYCLRRVHRDHAPDVAADVFTVAWRRRESIPEPAFVLPWLFAVAARTVANHRRGQRRRSNLVAKASQFVEAGSQGPEPLVVRRSEDEAVLKAVDSLRPNDKETILLSAWEGLSATQIAARFGISVAAAEKRLTRAKHRLGVVLARTDKQLQVAPRAGEGGTR